MARVQTQAVIFELVTKAIPKMFSIIIFIAGGFLLYSTFRPIDGADLPVVKDLLPLGLVEASHIIGTLVALSMIFLARGLWERIEAAWYAAIAAFVVGAVISLTREIDLVAMAIFTICGLLILPCKSSFNRRSNLFQLAPNPIWTIVSLASLAFFVWLGFYLYQHVPYAHNLWVTFTYESGASRFLRTLVILGLGVLILALMRLFGIANHVPDLPDAEDMARLKLVVEGANSGAAWLSLMGDKYILWDKSHTAFLMYGIYGKSWVVMGAPFGPEAAVKALCWQIKAMADVVKANLSFYQVEPKELPLMIDLGLSLYKIGEEAMIDAQSFDLSGKKGYGFRQTLRRFEALGARCEILQPSEIEANFDEISAVSQNWLKHKKGREKAFSLGAFHKDYVTLMPMAVIKINGRIMAFANLWPTVDKSSLSIDLMRYTHDAPPGIMEYMFLKLIEQARTEGYAYFSLGLAPLAGLETNPLSHFWAKFGNLIYDLGGGFFNFEGLRAYKDKFKPQWQPRYFAVSGHEPALIAALIALNTLNNG